MAPGFHTAATGEDRQRTLKMIVHLRPDHKAADLRGRRSAARRTDYRYRRRWLFIVVLCGNPILRPRDIR